MEVRFLSSSEGKAQVVNAEKRTIRGYGIVFNKESDVLRTRSGQKFVEVIRPEAVKGIDFSRVVSMHNHDVNRLLGTGGAGTMRTGIDHIGVWYETDLPNSPTGQDVFESVSRGDTTGSSFQFSVRDDGEKWTMRAGGIGFREVVQFEGVYEIGPVTSPAYPDTTISKKSLRSLMAAIGEEMPLHDTLKHFEGIFKRDDGEMEDEGPGIDDPNGNTPASKWDLSFMIDQAAWALYRSNDFIYSMSNWIENFDDFAEKNPSEAAILSGIVEQCKNTKSALVSLVGAYADAIKSLNGSEGRSFSLAHMIHDEEIEYEQY